jgi:benzoate membrane transport protein
MRGSVVVSALVAVIVGFFGALAVVLAATRAVGATPEETSSWVTALCLTMAVTTPILSLRHRLPIVTAWSTPGAALIAASSGVSMSAAVGAFLLANALMVLTALFRPLSAWIEKLPTSVAAAMLAGVLIRFVIAVFDSAQAFPALVLPLVALFLVMRLISPFGAVLIVLVTGVVLAEILGLNGPMPGVAISSLVFIAPTFDPAVLIGLGVPLYLVTMASQNLPGFAVLKAAGYQVPSRSIIAVTGLASLATAPFGAHASNLAAISASICTGPDAHPDKEKRWMTGPFYGAAYLVLAVFGASLVSLFHALPQALIVTVAGTALLGALSGALGSAMADEKDRIAATLTLAVTASGFSFLGIGSAFWGLAAGLVTLGLSALWSNRR